MTAHNTHKRQTFIPPAGFESAILASERMQLHALDRLAIGVDRILISTIIYLVITFLCSKDWEKMALALFNAGTEAVGRVLQNLRIFEYEAIRGRWITEHG
jgi:hypothetical protein